MKHTNLPVTAAVERGSDSDRLFTVKLHVLSGVVTQMKPWEEKFQTGKQLLQTAGLRTCSCSDTSRLTREEAAKQSHGRINK